VIRAHSDETGAISTYIVSWYRIENQQEKIIEKQQRARHANYPLSHLPLDSLVLRKTAVTTSVSIRVKDMSDSIFFLCMIYLTTLSVG
jgi:hypothetical protein